MKCWHCNHELIWQNDYDLEEGYDSEAEAYSMITTLLCYKCETKVLVYLPNENYVHWSDEENDDEND